MQKGRIIKALSGFYYVLPDSTSPLNGPKTVQCRARGVFKNKGISPLVGDFVTFEHTDNGDGTVTEIAPRHTELIRPPIANVDLAVLVFSVVQPSWNAALLDKFLVHTESAGLDSIIVLTKADLLEQPEFADEWVHVQTLRARYENIGYTIIEVSAHQARGIEAVRQALQGKTAVLAGQSGVGKSSLVNALMPGLKLETNEISNKLGRGKHTTRHVELIALSEQSWLADTPGFSQLDFLQVEAEGLSACFIEFAPYAEQCKFRGCSHHHEPKCKVIDAVSTGEITRERYDQYIQFLLEIQDKKRRY
jgi:ribosome biogenesis GTPase